MRLRLFATLCAFALVAAACGDDTGSDLPPAGSGGDGGSGNGGNGGSGNGGSGGVGGGQGGVGGGQGGVGGGQGGSGGQAGTPVQRACAQAAACAVPDGQGGTLDEQECNGTFGQLIAQAGDTAACGTLLSTAVDCVLAQPGCTHVLECILPVAQASSGACAPAGVCGDDTVNAGEQCDDGNTLSGDGCSATCQTEAVHVCGDGTVDAGEQCDDGNRTAGDGCDANCLTETAGVCGDGFLDLGEQCDDGNTMPGDGCDAACLIELLPFCGDGMLGAGEQCDDGNTMPGDGCDAACMLEAVACMVDADCGGMVGSCQLGACTTALTIWSQGTTTWPDQACNSDTSFGSCNTNGQAYADEWARYVCAQNGWAYGAWTGNKLVGCAGDASMYCWDGIPCQPELEISCQPNDQTQVEITCSMLPIPVCGNGAVEGFEGCDDGNPDNGDGCDESCRIEVVSLCGNGMLDATEECDDGNTTPGDGCDPFCVLEVVPGALVGSFVVGDGPAYGDPATLAVSCTQACAQLFGGVWWDYDCSTDGATIDNHAFVDGWDAGSFCSGAGAPEDFFATTAADGRYDCGTMGCSYSAYVNDHGCGSVNYCFTTLNGSFCGNGMIDAGEGCDDGNPFVGDGCDAACQIEVPPSVCGNGVVEAGEQCDDGNLVGGDGCDAACQTEILPGSLVGSFAVNSGPGWTDPATVSYSCIEACAAQFGGTATDYACSTDAVTINHRAFADGYADSQYCTGNGIADDFRLPANGGPYNCGAQGCAYSAWVSDNGCASINYCFAAGCLSDVDCGGAVGSCQAGSCVMSMTRWSAGTTQWPDQACNSNTSFGSCNTNDPADATAWASYVCQQNGWAAGTWTGNKIAGCAGDISMYCNLGSIPCVPNVENSCQPGDQTQIEFTCTR